MKASNLLLSRLHQHLTASALLPNTPDTLKRYAKHGITPLATLMCGSYADIQTAIKFCNNNAIDFVVKSGGRNQSSNSIRSNALVLDLTPLKKVQHLLKPDQMKIKIQAGVNFRELQSYLNGVNLKNEVGYTVPFAWDRNISCIGAHTVMGNGLSHRKCGMGVDLIQQATVLLSNGEIVKANKQNNPDLLWAIKGCGISMGVVLDITQNLPQRTCNVVDPQANKEIRMRSFSFPIDNTTLPLGKDLSKFMSNIEDHVFPYSISIMNAKFSATYLMAYQMMYDKKEKRIIQKEDLSIDKMMHDMASKYKGKKYYQNETIYETLANTALKQAQTGKSYYYIWGGFTNISQLPKLWQQMTDFYINNPIKQLKDEQATIITNIVSIQSESFRNRNSKDASLPLTNEQNVLIYGNITFKDEQNGQECYNYIKCLELALKEYLKVGSLCDINAKDIEINANYGKWILGHNYEKLKKIHEIYDPQFRFSKGLF